MRNLTWICVYFKKRKTNMCLHVSNIDNNSVRNLNEKCFFEIWKMENVRENETPTSLCFNP